MGEHQIEAKRVKFIRHIRPNNSHDLLLQFERTDEPGSAMLALAPEEVLKLLASCLLGLPKNDLTIGKEGDFAGLPVTWTHVGGDPAGNVMLTFDVEGGGQVPLILSSGHAATLRELLAGQAGEAPPPPPGTIAN